MACKRIAKDTTKQESQLFDYIYNNIAKGNEELADEYYTYFKTESFKTEFGDWIEDFKRDIYEKEIDQRKVDDNGEPRLKYNKAKAYHYYENKNGNKIPFPNNRGKLNESYSNEAIRSITKILALNYFKDRIGENFNDIDLSEKIGTLSESIKTQIENKSNELINSEDFEQHIKGKVLANSLQYVDEWTRLVEDYFRELKLVYKESTETDEMIEDENETREGQTFGKASFEKSVKDNVSSNIKLALSVLVDINNKDDLFYEPTFIPFNEVYDTLQKILTDNIAIYGEDLFEIYLQEIANLSDKKPYLNDLLLQLKKMDDYKKAEFVQAFNLSRNTFIGTIINIVPVKEKGEVVGYKTNISVQDLSNVGGKETFIKGNWYHNFIRNFANENNQFDKESVNNLTRNRTTFDNLYKEFKTNYGKDQYNEDTINEPIAKLISFYNSLGVVVTEEGINHFLDNLQPESVETEDKLKNLNKLIESTKYLLDNLKLNELKKNKNVFDFQSDFIKLARAEAFYLSEGSDASIFTTGKSKWLYSYPSYLSNKLKEWKKNRNALLHHYNSTEKTKHSHWMRWLLALDENNNREAISEDRIANFNLNIFNSLQMEGDAFNADSNTDLSKNDAIADMANKTLGFRGDNKKTYLNSPTPADKSTQYVFDIHRDMMINTNTKVRNGQAVVTEQAQKIIYNYIKGEFERIKVVQQEIKLADGDNSQLVQHYHLGNKNGLRFQIFPDLNYDKVDPNNEDKRIKVFDSEKMGFSLYNNDGSIIDYTLPNIETIDDISELEPNSVEAKLFEFIQKEISRKIQETRRTLHDAGIFDRVDGKSINRAISEDIWESYEATRPRDLQIAGDVFVNNLISQIEYSNMFAGDVAYYKDMADYNKRVPATYTDGLQLYIKPGQEMFNASVISGVSIATPYITELENTIGKEAAKPYRRINSTDAQAWITPNRWKFLLQGLGKWSDKYDAVFDKLTDKNKEPWTIDEMKLAAQPLKGVYFEINEGRPVYLKYSQAVLIPSILENSPGLAKLADKMKDNDIDELITIDGVKVGAFSPVDTHNEDGSVKDDFELVKMPLKNSGWKLQQDLPVKTNKLTDIGSQIQKNIFGGIVNNLEGIYTVDGVDMSGRDLIKHINSIISKLSEKGLESLFNEFGIDSNYKITNIDRLNESLINELKSRGAAQNVIDALESGITSYAIPGYQQKIQNVFASMVTKRLVKIQTNGGSYIQMSNYGFSNDQANNAGVIYTPWAKEKTHEPELIKEPVYNDEGDLIEKGIIRPGGILISGSFIAKYIPDYNKKSTEELFGTKENNYTDGLIDPKILRSIIGYRIPNQGLASNDALEIVGILPEGMGDTVVAYTGITTKTGSDFDIDKMYIMMPSFKPRYSNSTYKKGYKYIRDNNITKEDIIEELVAEGYNEKFLNSTSELNTLFVEDILFQDSDNPFRLHFSKLIKEGELEKLSYTTGETKDGLANQLIEAYKSVLTHPDMIGQIMTPIDYDFMKDDILSLFPEPEINNLDSFDILNQINIKYEFLAGKAGVGITANQLVDHVRGMMSELYIPYLNIGKSTNGKTKLDNEYSEELTDAELKQYEKEINKGRKEADKIDVSKLKSIRIADSLSAIMNANVDIAKDSYITRGNWTTQTSNIGQMLIRAGVHPFKVNAILGQPIIKEYSEFLVNQESKIVNNTGNMKDKFIESKIIEELSTLQPVTINGITRSYRDIYKSLNNYTETIDSIKKLFEGISETEAQDITDGIEDVIAKYNVDSKKLNLNDTSLTYLRNNIKNQNNDPEFQMSLFDKFSEWNKISKDLVVQNIKASKPDVDGYGKDISSLIVNFNLVNKLLNPKFEFEGFRSKLRYDNELTLLGTYINNSIFEVKKIMEANPLTFLAAHPTVINTFNEISKGINGDVLIDQKLADKINTHFYSYFMSGFKPFQMNEQAKEELIKTLPEELQNFKKNNPDYKNVFIDELDVKINEVNDPFISMNNRKKSPSFQTDITTGWLDLMDDHPILSEKLIRYSFISSGLQSTINQFHTYIPYQVFAQNNINDYIKEVSTDLSNLTVDNGFIDSFFRHNIEDNSIVKNVFNSDTNRYYKNTPAGFVMKGSGRGNLYVKKDFEAFDETGAPFNIPYLFKLEGYTKQNKAIYTRSAPLGYSDRRGNKFYEYDRNNELVPTIFPGNKLRNILYRENGKLIDNRNYFKDLVDRNIYGDTIKDVNTFNNNQENDITDINNIESKYPEFDKLPFKSTIPTFTYAGIGSRETPQNIQDEMTKLGKELEERGYTLRSGGAQGADLAFEKEVNNKEIFLGKDKVGERELKIAREIHPAPFSLDRTKNPSFVWNLMGRNTNQIFGKNLDTPVDFVIAWTQDGLENYQDRTVKSGGTGQAISLASMKNIPVINMNNPSWREKLDNVLKGKNINSNKGQLSLFDQIDDVFLNDDNC